MHLLALPRDQKWMLQGPLRVGFSALYRVGPGSYYAKLSVLWVKKLLSEVDRHLYLLTPIPNQP